MNILDFLFFTIFVNKPFLLEAKIDTGILLVIESSIQNQDYDILCALRNAVSNLTQQGNTPDRDVNMTLSYIDMLHDCFPKELSTTTKRISFNDSILKEGNYFDIDLPKHQKRVQTITNNLKENRSYDYARLI